MIKYKPSKGMCKEETQSGNICNPISATCISLLADEEVNADVIAKVIIVM